MENENIKKTLWPFYFSQDTYDPRDSRLQLVDAFENVFINDIACSKFLNRAIDQSLGSTASSFSQLKPIYFNAPRLDDLLPMDDFYQSLCRQPTAVIGTLGFAISLWVSRTRIINHSFPPVFNPRFLSLLSDHSFGDLKSSSVGQLVAVRGYVVRVSASKPLIVGASFKCGKCLGCIPAVFEDGIYNPPTECQNPVAEGSKRKCNNRGIELERTSAQVSDYQRIKLQEIEEEEGDSTNARIPRTFDIEARDDLIDKCICGDVVQVVGIVKTMQTEPMKGSRGNQKESGLHSIYMVANSIIRVKGTKQRPLAGKKRNGETDIGPWTSPKLQRCESACEWTGGENDADDDATGSSTTINGNRLREGTISQQHIR